MSLHATVSTFMSRAVRRENEKLDRLSVATDVAREWAGNTSRREGSRHAAVIETAK
jgi:hypothetical protein